MKITLEMAKKVLEVVDAGLVSGIGKPELGHMCVEAAVCFALGEPHGDEPSCVAPSVRRFKIRLNDSRWSSNAARTAGMRKLAIAQLGSRDSIDEIAFCKTLAKLIIQRVLPPILRKVGLVAEAARCEDSGSRASAVAAKNAAYAAADAAASAYAAAYAAADADATASAAAAAATAYAVAYAAAYATATATASASASAASASAAAAAAAAYGDAILTISASCCLDALRAVNAPGVALLDELGI